MTDEPTVKRLHSRTGRPFWSITWPDGVHVSYYDDDDQVRVWHVDHRIEVDEPTKRRNGESVYLDFVPRE